MLDFAKIKKYLLFTLIGCVIASSIVAVITVLFGSFTATTMKTFYTLLAAFVHALVGLLFIWNDERAKKYNTLSFFVNTLFFIVVISFITNVFGIWDIIPGQNVAKMYITYAMAVFASLHADVLSRAVGKEKLIDNIVYSNIVFIAIILLMLQPIVHLKNPQLYLNNLYYRILAAGAIIDGTLSILAIIFYKLYIHKHPELIMQKKSGIHIWQWVLLILFGLWFVPMLIRYLFYIF